MTREETKKIVMMIGSIYVQALSNKTKEELSEMIDVWQTLLEDMDANQVALAVKTMLQTDEEMRFFPTPAMIRAKVRELYVPKGRTEQEAWTRLLASIGNSGYHAKREWENLPKDIQSLCTPSQLYDWSQMDTSTLNSVVASNFMRSYKVRSQETKQYDKLPNQTKDLIESIKDTLKLDNKDDEEDDE